MKSTNVFRFVSLRPPNVAPVTTEFSVADREAAPAIVDKVKEETRRRKNYEAARHEVGRQILESDDYFVRSPLWEEIRPAWPKVRELLSALEAAKDPAHDDFADEAEDLLKGRLGDKFDLDKWLKGDEVVARARVLWKSYYAAVLTELRGQDRGEILDWIRFLHLLALRGKPERFAAAARRATRLRAAVPVELVALEPTPPPADQPPHDPPDDKEGVEIERRIGILTETRQAFAKLFERKLRLFTQLEVGPFVRAAVAVPGPRPEADERKRQGAGAVAESSGADLIKAAPWRINAEDVDRYGEHLDVLHDLGLDPLVRTIPEITQAIDERVALLEARRFELQAAGSVLGAGKTFVRVTR